MTLRISHVKNKNNLKNKILTLYQLVYISKAVKTFSASELKIIFERVDGLQPWGALLGEESKSPRKRRTYRITKKIKLEDAE